MSETERRKAHPLIAPLLLTIISISGAVFTFAGMSGRTNRLSQGEILEIFDVKCELDPFGNWEIVVRLNNSGVYSVRVSKVYVNNKEVSLYGSDAPQSATNTITTELEKNTVIQDRGSLDVTFWIGARYWFFASGSCVTVKIRSSNGMECEKTILLV